MSENRIKKTASVGTGGGTVARAYSSGSPSPIILPNASVCQVPTVAGGPVVWAIADSLYTLQAELEAIGLTCPFEAIQAAYAKMLGASYIPRCQRRAVLREMTQ